MSREVPPPAPPPSAPIPTTQPPPLLILPPSFPSLPIGAGNAGRSDSFSIIPVLAVLVALCGVVLASGTGWLVRPDRIVYPESWDPRVVDLVDFVEHERGLDFDHPVTVNFLSDEEYAEASNGGGDFDQAEIAEAALDDLGTFRALGLIQGDVDLAKAQDDLFDAGTLAYYDPELKIVNVRGDSASVATDVTIAHELTHALQDQHFDLTGGFKLGDPEAYRSIVEGDATAVENAYVDQLDDADAAAYDEESTAQSDATGEALDELEVPGVLSAIFGSYYELGGPFVDMVLADGGHGALNELLDEPLQTTGPLFNPTQYFDDVEPAWPVAAESADEDDIIDESNFGAMWTYLTLAARIDPQQAMHATDLIVGDDLVRLRDGDRLCVAIAWETATTGDAATVEDAVREWADSMPPEADVTVRRRKGRVNEVRSCDPGPDADLGVDEHTGDEAVMPIVRSYFMADAMDAGEDPDFSFCGGDEVVAEVPMEIWQQDGDDPQSESLISKAIDGAISTC